MEEKAQISRWEPLIEDLKHTAYLWKKNKLAMFGGIIILAFIVVAIFAPVIAPYDPYEQNLANRLSPPSWEHLLGTDQYGRDIFSRIVWGTRIELKIIFLVTVISTSIGIVIGIVSGYFGGVVDEVLMRITDMFLAFPSLVLAMAFASALGPSLINAIIAISIVSWTVYARLVRAETIKIKNMPYIEAIRSLGASTPRILFLHIFPMTVSPVLVQMTLRMGSIILSAAGLGFLGLGAQPPTPEWGAMVSDGRLYIMNAWWISTFSGFAIALVVLGFNFLGDGVRDIMDPRLRR